MEGQISKHTTETIISNLKDRIRSLEIENAELKKKMEATTATRLGFHSVSFGSPCMNDPDPEPVSVGRVWKEPRNMNWRVEGI
jgi:hypothetical protein